MDKDEGVLKIRQFSWTAYVYRLLVKIRWFSVIILLRVKQNMLYLWLMVEF